MSEVDELRVKFKVVRVPPVDPDEVRERDEAGLDTDLREVGGGRTAEREPSDPTGTVRLWGVPVERDDSAGTDTT